MAEHDPSTGREPSDLFQVEKPKSSIAPVDRIVLPPEEAMRHRLRQLALGLVLLAVLVFIGWLIAGWMHRARVQTALENVVDDGSATAITHALDLVGEDGDPAIIARLYATRAMGGDTGALAQAKSLAAKNENADDPNLRIARIYIALAEGDARAAHTEAERPARYEKFAGAFLQSRTLNAIARGQWEQALGDAQNLLSLHPDASKPLATSALITAKVKGPQEALAILDDADDDNPEVMTTYARILGLQQLDAEKTQPWLKALRESNDAAPAQRAWGELIAGMLAYRRGAVGQAYQHAKAAAGLDFAGDELLLVDTAKLLLALGRTHEAEIVLKRLSSGPSADLFDRTHALGWWYAQSGDTRAGLATLSGAGFDADDKEANGLRALVLAELLSRSSRSTDRSRAVALWDTASKDAVWGVVASDALARAQQEAGDHEQALATLRAALGRHPHHLTLVHSGVQLLLATGQPAAAEVIAKDALNALADEGWAHGDYGAVLLSLGRTEEALQEIDRAVELDPHDAGLHALRGDAYRSLKNAAQAKAAYQQALTLDANDARALSGFLALSLDTNDLAEAGKLYAQMATAKVGDLRSDEQRLAYLIRTGAGQSGLSDVRGALGRHEDNASLTLDAARAYMQADQFSSAARYFQQAQRLGADARLSLAGAALAYAYDRKYRTAEKQLEKAAEAPASDDPQVRAWELIARARIDLAGKKRGPAAHRARQAQELAPDSADVFLLQADLLEERERSPEAPLRQAANAPIPMPVAAGRLAILLGPTDEGCAFAKRYLEADRGGRLPSQVRQATRDCK